MTMVENESYTLGIKELDAALGGSIKSGSNIMIIGPPMSGKDELLYNIVLSGIRNNNAAIIVSTREPGESVLDWFKQQGQGLPVANIGIVDC
ncbi:MAG TPA: recombinase RecA, partial [Candidatus Methanoperedenaceae archaeon]|nr:recombinase RecA [Candidatus Methanoperedenaceae archaeon]